MNIHSGMVPPSLEAPTPSGKREAILRAALHLMGERSMDGATMPEIAREARVGAGTLYRYFDGKESLVNSVYRETKLEMQRFLADATAGSGTPREEFGRLWRGLWNYSRKHPESFRFLEMHRHQQYLDPASCEVSRSVFEGVAGFVRRSQKEGAIRPSPPDALIAMAFGAFVGLIKEAEAGHVSITEETVEISESAVWAMLRA